MLNNWFAARTVFVVAEVGMAWGTKVLIGFLVKKRSIQTVRCTVSPIIWIMRMIVKFYYMEDFFFGMNQFIFLLGVFLEALLFYKFTFKFRLEIFLNKQGFKM